MTNEFEKLSHKPTKYGDGNFLRIMEASSPGYIEGNICGVNIFTDNAELGANIGGTPAYDSDSPNLFYLTGDSLPLLDIDDCLLVRPMEPGLPGEIYVDSTLKNFGFSGKPIYGTVSHLAYGIRTLDRVPQNILGLHASVLYDTEGKGCRLFVGPSQVGKSTIAKALEEKYPDRFTVLGDDWAEIDMSTNTVDVVSPLFASREGKIGEDDTLFENHGKTYYKPEIPYPTTHVPLLSVTEIHPEPDLDFQSFFKKSMSAVPFVISEEYQSGAIPELSKESTAIPLALEIQHRMDSYRDMYRTLVDSHGTRPIVNCQADGVMVFIEKGSAVVYNEA